eukprot:CAMPEP_0196230404 /NCGR_PEP_ID=MMETSP0913-20130531/1618_1 /TAXON_ID=49265 /ORGANISM="Thalassiosira rotula, Strain GSO102" /LENGTH=238 /DNA_ID=CAMNT_0041510423 /DNA_START=69 /DNA_END=785 /DNA_ORIENTATION=-
MTTLTLANTVQYNTTKQQYTPHDHRHPYITQSSSSSSSSSRRNFSAISPKRPQVSNPFRTLKIPKDAKYSHAKKSFLKIAMKHHPDTVSTECEITQKKSQEIFMKCRAALESLVECEDTGLCLLRSEVEELEDRSMSDEEFDSWFEEETGHQNPFSFDLDPAVMREVASMHDDMAGSHGLDRDGGMWHLASLISSAVKKGKDGAESVLKLEAGSIREGENVEAKGKLERRRKRVRGRR